LVPSTLTVTNNLDSGHGSLRYEIAHAQNRDTIVFAPSLDGKTITLTSGELDITAKSLTIDGPGANELAVSGGNTSRVFEVAAASSVTLNGLTISNGYSLEGGGILNAGRITVTGCTVSGNYATNSGGGIYNTGTLTVSDCNLFGNIAVYDGGGGIFNAGTLTVNGGDVSLNRAGAGGGIYNAGTATVGHCTLAGDDAISGDIYSVGGGIDNAGTAGALTVLDSSFILNRPDNIVGPYTDGGGNTFS
jgi:predicted outer membrane repeat protein